MDGAAASRVPRMANWKIKCDAVKRLLTATPAFWNTILFTRTMATEHTVLSKMRRKLRERMANSGKTTCVVYAGQENDLAIQLQR